MTPEIVRDRVPPRARPLRHVPALAPTRPGCPGKGHVLVVYEFITTVLPISFHVRCSRGPVTLLREPSPLRPHVRCARALDHAVLQTWI